PPTAEQSGLALRTVRGSYRCRPRPTPARDRTSPTPAVLHAGRCPAYPAMSAGALPPPIATTPTEPGPSGLCEAARSLPRRRRLIPGPSPLDEVAHVLLLFLRERPPDKAVPRRAAPLHAALPHEPV